MKLSLDELKVDSYAVQVSETELAEVKGGTTLPCATFGVSAASLILAAYVAWRAEQEKPNKNQGSGAPSGGNTGSGAVSGGIGSDYGNNHKPVVYYIDSFKYQGMTFYGIDSIHFN